VTCRKVVSSNRHKTNYPVVQAFSHQSIG
jgi:hypothetical protein